MPTPRKVNRDNVLRDLASGFGVREAARRNDCSPGTIKRIQEEAGEAASAGLPHVPHASHDLRSRVARLDLDAAEALEREAAAVIADSAGWDAARREWTGEGPRTFEVEIDGKLETIVRMGRVRIVEDKVAVMDSACRWLTKASDLRRRASGMPTTIAARGDDGENVESDGESLAEKLLAAAAAIRESVPEASEASEATDARDGAVETEDATSSVVAS